MSGCSGEGERLLRRQFLITLAGFGVLGAFAWVTVPTLAELARATNASLPAQATTTPTLGKRILIRGYEELLASLPCFCGCAGYQPPHRNLLDCFIRTEGGFESHAAQRVKAKR